MTLLETALPCPVLVPAGTPSDPAIYTIIDLGTLGGAATTAEAINNRGQVVGSGDIPSGQRHAYLWEPGR